MDSFNSARRELLRFGGMGFAAAAATSAPFALALPKSYSNTSPLVFDVRNYGAKGDGKTVDTPAINQAIEAAAGAGGGTVNFPAGTFVCFSIHLRSHVHLAITTGTTP
jgi:polygalacturonase